MSESAYRYWTEPARLVAITAYESRSAKLCGGTVTMMLNKTRRPDADSDDRFGSILPIFGQGGKVWNRRN